MISKFRNFFNGNQRTVLLKKNIIGSVILKGISMIISFFIVPITINFVNPTQYGIWLTLSSLMSWFYFFDIGLTHGFRNRFAEAKANDDIKLARIYVSTTYATLFLLCILMWIIVLPINSIINWSEILNIDSGYREELGKVFMIMILFLGLNIVSQVFSTLVIADQRPVMASLIQVLGQTMAFVTIYILVNTIHDGNLLYLAFIFSGVPVIVLIIASIALFRSKYRIYRPSINLIRFQYVKNILGIGSKFFIITTSMLFIFQLMNVIISRILGPETVTEYNIAYKYFNLLFMLAIIILNPFWSAFTDAYTRKDYDWMRKMFQRLECLWLISIPVIIVMFFIAPWFYKLWLGSAVEVSFATNISVAGYTVFLMLANVYMYLINGIGKVQIQLIIYLSFALIAYPLMNLCCRLWGIPGILLIPTLVYIFQAILGRIQLIKILKANTSGIWDK